MSDFQERRQDNLQLQGTLLKLAAKLDSIETNIGIKLESFDGKLSNLEEKFSNILDIKSAQIEALESKIERHNECLDETKETISLITAYKTRIMDLQARVDGFDKRISVLETAPVRSKAKVIDDLTSAITKAIYIGTGGLVVAALIYLIKAVVK